MQMLKNDPTHFFKVEVNSFKNFINEMYYMNQNEREYFKLELVSREEYIKNNKWFLKRLFKESKNGNA